MCLHELESRKGCWGQSVSEYLGLALVFIWDGALRRGLNRYFGDFFASID